LILAITFSVKAAESVVVSAVVWNINHAPVIVSILPNWNPEIIENNSLQNFSITFRDDELNHMYYTITTESDWGYTSPISWEITVSQYNWNQANLNFSYLAPQITGAKKITITLNDWPNVVSKDINLYIY
jgi:hypothetical protein